MELHLVVNHLQSAREDTGGDEADGGTSGASNDETRARAAARVESLAGADEVSSAAWRNTIRGIGRNTFDFMNWQPHENFGGPTPVSLSGLFEIFFCSPQKRASMAQIIDFLEKLPSTGRTREAGTWDLAA